MTYAINEVAKMMNIPATTIRYYDKEGLLPYLERKDSGYRIFHKSDVEMLRLIECFKRTGMSIKEIKEFIELVKQGDSSLQQRYDMVVNHKENVQKQLDDIQKQMAMVNHKIEYYKTALEAGTEDIHKNKNKN
ncbi:MAG: MerR family transcriptional regulator [Thomasclavelia sp.]|nr:MerR family transcriptional regulator [Thomasclavelia sp.]